MPFNDEPVSIAAANDGTFLYLVLTASDRAARMQILRRGLIVWFDGAGGEKKRFGIKFPVGAGLTEEELRDGYGPSGRRRGADQPSSGSDDQESPKGS